MATRLNLLPNQYIFETMETMLIELTNQRAAKLLRELEDTCLITALTRSNKVR